MRLYYLVEHRRCVGCCVVVIISRGEEECARLAKEIVKDKMNEYNSNQILINIDNWNWFRAIEVYCSIVGDKINLFLKDNIENEEIGCLSDYFDQLAYKELFLDNK